MKPTNTVFTAVLLAALVVTSGAGGAEACTAAHLGLPTDSRLTAANYDWTVPGGQLVVNTRGLVKNALIDEEDTPVAWTSRFGSVTFNQYGREFPIGGMNQMGLVLQVLWLEKTMYPPVDDRPSIRALQWVQYCLDRFPTIDHVITSARELSIQSVAPLHLLACDRTGACATIEFIDRELVLRTGETLPIPVLTNDTYEDSIQALNQSLGYAGTNGAEDRSDSLDRWVRAATAVNQFRANKASATVDDAFRILGQVANPELTQWSIVYDQMGGTVHFTTRGHTARRSVSLRELDLRCLTGARTLDLEAKLSGDVGASLVPYDAAKNLEVVRRNVASTEFLKSTPESSIMRTATYPDALFCSRKARGITNEYDDWIVPPVAE